jgi:hypothetical protein
MASGGEGSIVMKFTWEMVTPAETASVSIAGCSMSKSRSVIPVASTNPSMADDSVVAVLQWLST